jgi:hypothetical protein
VTCQQALGSIASLREAVARFSRALDEQPLLLVLPPACTEEPGRCRPLENTAPEYARQAADELTAAEGRP